MKTKIWPPLFLLLTVFNILIHKDVGHQYLSFILLPVLGFYALLNTITIKTVQWMKKAIILTCLVNCAIFATECLHINSVFTVDWSSGFNRPQGFMVYPFEFAMLCAISLLFVWELRWTFGWAILPIAACLALSHEYTPILALFAVLTSWKRAWLRLLVFLAFMYLVMLTLNFFAGGVDSVALSQVEGESWHEIVYKFAIRWHFIQPVLAHLFDHPFIGQGLNAFSKYSTGNWSELHCEWLDLWLCFGILGIVWAWGFINSLRGAWDVYSKIFVMVGIVSCVQSTFHYMDLCWLCVIIYLMFSVERNHENI